MEREELIQIIIESVSEVDNSVGEGDIYKIIDDEIMINIDSLLGITLITILEEKLGISLPDNFLTSENCSSLNKIIESYFDLLKRRGIYVR